MEKVIGLKELRENVENYVSEVKRGRSFIVLKRSVPVFKISPPDEDAELWEQVIDFTKFKKGGVGIKDILSRL